MSKCFNDKNVTKGLLSIIILLLPFHIFSTTISIKKSGEKKNILKKIERTGHNSITYENEDRTFIKDIFLGYINYKGKDGRWYEIKTNIIRKEDGSFENTENTFKTKFMSETDDNEVNYESETKNIKWSIKSISFIDSAGKEILKYGKNKVKARVQDNKISYENIFNNITDEYIVKNNLIKNNIIIKSLPRDIKADKLKIEGTFTLPENSRVTVNRKTLWFLNSEEETQSAFQIKVDKDKFFRISAPHIYDSAVISDKGKKGIAFDKTFGKYKIKKQGNKLIIILTIDYSWLSDPKRMFPVYMLTRLFRFFHRTYIHRQLSMILTLHQEYPRMMAHQQRFMLVAIMQEGYGAGFSDSQALI